MFSGEVESLDEVVEGETIAEGIRIKSPLRADEILNQIRISDGTAIAVEEKRIIEGREALARLGLYIEPTSSVVWPALVSNLDRFKEPIVVILTGSGFKSSIN